MKRVLVHLHERSYPVYIGPHAFLKLGDRIRAHGLKGTAIIATQKQIWDKWGNRLRSLLESSRVPHRLYLTKTAHHSEQSKSLPELLRLVAQCAKWGRGQELFLIAFGGGVIGDLTGFAASIYRRGIPYIQLPTTLTAQIDSAVGGKTGIDLPQGKNLLGAFYQPRFVLVDPVLLQSLPQKDYLDGIAELIKYGIIRDPGILRVLEGRSEIVKERKPHVLTPLIIRSVKIKAGVVSRDERDQKEIRMILNFGHTLGHAIENAASYREYTHGEAISIGMRFALNLSGSMGVLRDNALGARLERLLEIYSLPARLKRKLPPGRLLSALSYDKKNMGSTNRFVLVERPGKAVIYRDVPQNVIVQHVHCFAKAGLSF